MSVRKPIDARAAPGNKTMQLLERVSPPEDGDERGGAREERDGAVPPEGRRHRCCARSASAGAG